MSASRGSPDSNSEGELLAANGAIGGHTARYRPYKLPDTEYTPPASPLLSTLYNVPGANKSVGMQRSLNAESLQTVDRLTEPSHNISSPSPSPTLPPPLPSPFLPHRQREAALLRQATASSVHSNHGYPTPEYTPSSPTFPSSSTHMRHAAGPGLPSHPRSLFNALGSNPVRRTPSMRYSRENSWVQVQSRARGLTSASNPYPVLRSATSIQDYSQFRSPEKPKLSGTYRPNRGGANWTHNEVQTVRSPQSRDEARTSLTSWTNASSSFIDASGTERSSMATGRTSLSETQSVNSKELSDMPQPLSEDDAVDDFLNYYCESPTGGYTLPDLVPQILPEIAKDQETTGEANRDAYQELSELPRLPVSKSRMSRQDLADFQAYGSKYANKRDRSIDESREKAASPTQTPVIKVDSLPELDENVVRPRRASTSVFDRRSAFIDLGRSTSPNPSKSESDSKLTGKRTSDRTIAARMSMSAHERDRYGFKKATDRISVAEYNAWYESYEGYVDRRRKKWVDLMRKQHLTTKEPSQFPERSEKVKRYVRKGFPPEWRGRMWWFYSTRQYDLSEVTGIYPSLVARLNEGELNKDDREAIERDLDRTFPDNVLFRPNPVDQAEAPEPNMIKKLREVLQCFALHNPHIGYCQSLNFIGGLLLIFLDDLEKVFILMHMITKYHLPQAHARNLENTEVKILMMLIKDYLPKVWLSINDVDMINNGFGANAHPDSKFSRLPSVNIACTAWFMSLFINVLPIETVLRVWDSFFYEGPRTLFKYALAIFRLAEPSLRKLDPSNMAEICMVVQNTPRKLLDPSVLYDLVFMKKMFNSVDNALILQKRGFWKQQSSRVHKDAAPLVKTSSSEEKERKGSSTALKRQKSKRFWRKGERVQD